MSGLISPFIFRSVLIAISQNVVEFLFVSFTQINDELDNPTGEPIVCYVVVNRLPRNVSVEWHVIAMLTENRKRRKVPQIVHILMSY